jgi:hypothetical protein
MIALADNFPYLPVFGQDDKVTEWQKLGALKSC